MPATPPLFVTVSVCAVAASPCAALNVNEEVAVLKEAGASPVPAKATVKGPFNVALSALVVLGVKVTDATQVCPAATLAVQPETAKSVLLVPVIVKAAGVTAIF